MNGLLMSLRLRFTSRAIVLGEMTIQAMRNNGVKSSLDA
jgi:hypothetical protein